MINIINNEFNEKNDTHVYLFEINQLKIENSELENEIINLKSKI